MHAADRHRRAIVKGARRVHAGFPLVGTRNLVCAPNNANDLKPINT
jgi:hypothetical protein